jgi:hypothetical protein
MEFLILSHLEASIKNEFSSFMTPQTTTKIWEVTTWSCFQNFQPIEYKKSEHSKRVIRIHKLKDRQYNGQKKKDKHLSTKHYIEN